MFTSDESKMAEVMDTDRSRRGPGESGDGGVAACSCSRRMAGDRGALGGGDGRAIGRGDALLDLTWSKNRSHFGDVGSVFAGEGPLEKIILQDTGRSSRLLVLVPTTMVVFLGNYIGPYRPQREARPQVCHRLTQVLVQCSTAASWRGRF